MVPGFGLGAGRGHRATSSTSISTPARRAAKAWGKRPRRARGLASAQRFLPNAGRWLSPLHMAVCVHPRQSVDVDDVSIEPLVLPRLAAGVRPTFPWRRISCALARHAAGILREFRSKPSGKDTTAQGVSFPILRMIRRGVPRAHAQRGPPRRSACRVQFLDPELGATLRVSGGKRHLLLRGGGRAAGRRGGIDLWRFRLAARLKTIAGAMNATYDEQFGACVVGVHGQHAATALFPTAIDAAGAEAWAVAGGTASSAPASCWLPAPRDQLQVGDDGSGAGRRTALPHARRPARHRIHKPVRRSYLFVVDAPRRQTSTS